LNSLIPANLKPKISAYGNDQNIKRIAALAGNILVLEKYGRLPSDEKIHGYGVQRDLRDIQSYMGHVVVRGGNFTLKGVLTNALNWVKRPPPTYEYLDYVFNPTSADGLLDRFRNISDAHDALQAALDGLDQCPAKGAGRQAEMH
jgi:hypothetical protein